MIIMDEYIKKQDIYDELSKDYDYLTNYGKSYVNATIRMIKAIPAADVVEVRHGEWLERHRGQKSPEGYFYWNAPETIFICSECGRVEKQKKPYCPLCGAKMDGKDDK
jgi:rubrerythrin